jgi:hypothetical protein
MNSTLEASANAMEAFCSEKEGMVPYESMYLCTSSEIVRNKDFYMGICKLQSGNPSQLSTLEKTAINRCLNLSVPCWMNRETGIPRAQGCCCRVLEDKDDNEDEEMDLEIDSLSPKSKLKKLDKEAADDAARLSMLLAQAIVAQEIGYKVYP